MEETKMVQIRVPVWLKQSELDSFVTRLLGEKYGYVSIKNVRQRFGIKKLKNRIKVSRQEQKQILELRKKDTARARIA